MTASVFRQQVLMLWLAEPTLSASVLGWAFHDSTDGVGPQPFDTQQLAGGGDDPQRGAGAPYSDGVDALKDGWRVIQVSPQRPPIAGSEHMVSVLPNEFVFERMIDIATS